jgi:hypothetical protein
MIYQVEAWVMCNDSKNGFSPLRSTVNSRQDDVRFDDNLTYTIFLPALIVFICVSRYSRYRLFSL